MNRFLAIVLGSLFVGAAFTGCLKSGNNGSGPDKGAPPQAVASVTPLAQEVGKPVQFDASGSAVTGVTIKSVEWKFGDGKNASGTTTTHVYDQPGTYIILLNVTSATGLSANNDASLTYVTISPKNTAATDLTKDTPPVAVISASPQVLIAGGTVTFNANASYANVENPDFKASDPVDVANPKAIKDTTAIKTYAWDFGDGAAAMTGNKTAVGAVTHSYAKAGLYVAKLTVTDANGKTGTSGYSIYVLGSTATTPGGVKNPNVFTTVTINGPQSLDPGFDYETGGGVIIQQVYETLIYYDRDNFDRFIPLLAKEVPTAANGGIDKAGLNYTFHLRQGVKFHDGTELDSAAVKFSIDRSILMNDPNSAAWISGDIKGATDYLATNGTKADRDAYLAKNGVEAKDKYTVVIHLDKADPAFIARMAFYQAAVVSPTAFKAAHAERKALWGVDKTDDGLPPAASGSKPRVTRDPWADTNAVGTGPYKLRAWIANDRTILDRNEDYWGTKPKMRTVVIQYVDDVNTRILMLLSGDADDAYIPASLIEKVQGKPGVRVAQVDSITVATVFFGEHVAAADNCPKDAKTGAADCDALSDVHLRAAITYAMDKQTYVDSITKKLATLVPSVIPKGMFGFDASLQPIAFDLTKAKAELAKSKHPDGLTNLVLATNKANTVRMQTLQLLAQKLHEIGIEATIAGLSFPDLISGYQTHKFPAWMIGWAPDYAYPDDYVVPFLDGRSGTYAKGGSYNDPAMNALIDKATAEPDSAKQLEIWHQINKKAQDDFVHLWLSQAKNNHVERTWVTGYYYNPMDSGQPNVGYYAAVSKQ